MSEDTMTPEERMQAEAEHAETMQANHEAVLTMEVLKLRVLANMATEFATIRVATFDDQSIADGARESVLDALEALLGPPRRPGFLERFAAGLGEFLSNPDSAAMVNGIIQQAVEAESQRRPARTSAHTPGCDWPAHAGACPFHGHGIVGTPIHTSPPFNPGAFGHRVGGGVVMESPIGGVGAGVPSDLAYQAPEILESIVESVNAVLRGRGEPTYQRPQAVPTPDED